MHRLSCAVIIMFGAAAAFAQTTVPSAASITSGVSPTPAAAPVTTPAVTAKPKQKLICEDEETLGTRLGHHRICRTREQIAEQRRIDRIMIDRSQTQRSCGDRGC